MFEAVKIFNASISNARDLTQLHDYIVNTVRAPHPFDDLLRSQIVYAMSAFDKLMHDLIRIGMVASFNGNRPASARYHTELISMKVHTDLLAATIPPKEVLFEQEVIKKLAHLSFQDPDKVADGLSLIWEEKHKWEKIAGKMNSSTHEVKTRLKLAAGRRNAIVHESDMHPLNNTKTPITVRECSDVTDFVERCGRTIAALVN